MELVAHEASAGDSEDIVEFFECTLLGLGDEEEDHDESHHVEASVKAEGSSWREDSQDTWEGDGKDGGPEEAGCDGPTHTDFSV